MASKPYLTPNEAAHLLMVAPATLRVWTEKGLLKAHTTVGGHRRFDRSEIERHLRERDAATPLRVLIVDDDRAIAHYLRLLLEDSKSLPIVTATAHDGFSAGRLVQTFRPDLILLDLMMDGIDDIQVCRLIKDDAATRHIRVIAMTGYPAPENVERILAAGAEACLNKPLDEEQLLALLESRGGRRQL